MNWDVFSSEGRTGSAPPTGTDGRWTPGLGGAGGFKQPGCRDYIPLLQLCVCHYHLGDRALAAEYNERAGAVQPDSAAVAFNRGFFAGV